MLLNNSEGVKEFENELYKLSIKFCKNDLSITINFINKSNSSASNNIQFYFSKHDDENLNHTIQTMIDYYLSFFDITKDRVIHS